MSRYDIAQRFRENTGNVIGVKADVVHGDVFVHQYQVTVVAVGAGAREAVAQPGLTATASPFPGAAPFGYRGRGVFFGREVETDQLVRSIAAHQVTTLVGPSGCGKTSLLQAGVIPAVAFHGGVAVSIDDYQDASAALRNALEEASLDRRIAVALPDQTTLASLCGSLVAAGGTLVLILDQFERLLELDPEPRGAFLADIASLRESRLDVRIVIATSDEGYPRLAGTRIPDVLASSIRLDRLTWEQATEAVTKPLLQLEGPVQFADADIPRQVVTDLGNLSGEPPSVEPLHLQLVCDQLFARASDRRAGGGSPVIDQALYHAGDAAGIVNAWVTSHVQPLFPDDQLFARSVISAVLEDADGWVTARDLAPLGRDAADVEDALDRLAGIGLLRPRRVAETSFAFPSRAARSLALQFAGEDARRRLVAGEMLRGTWADWSANGYLVPRGQLRFLGSFDPPLATGLLQGLLLLRSAVSAGEDSRPWLRRLAALPRGELEPLMMLETGASPDVDSRLGRLFCLPAGAAGDRPRGYGPVAHQAVASEDEVSRETAVLGLSLVDGYENRLRAALANVPGIPAGRAPEAWAALDHAGVDVRAQVHGMERRARTWFTRRRIRDRLRRDQRTILVRAGVAAAGAGAGVALYWFVRSWITIEDWGPALATGWLWGSLLVLALVMGGEVVASAGARPGSAGGTSVRSRLGGWRAAVAAVVAFSLADLVVAWGSGYALADWQAWRLLSLGAGAALWVAYRWGPAGREGVAVVDVGLSLACGVIFGALQWVRSSVDGGLLISVSQAGDFLFGQLRVWDQAGLAVADAVLLGVSMAAGLRWGVRTAAVVLARWQAIDARTGS